MAEQKKPSTPRKKAGTASTEAKKKAAPKASAAPKKSTAAPKVSKPRAKKAPGNPGGVSRVSEEMRQHMIREAAYYRALNRGFAGSADLEDWLVAEREINTMLGRLTD